MKLLSQHSKLRRQASAACIALMLAGTGVVSAPAFAAQQTQAEREAEDQRRSRQTLSERSGRALNDALNLANEEPPQFQQAIARLDQLLSRSIPPYDEATALEIRGNFYFQVENYQGAIRDFRRALELDVLPSSREKNLVRGIAQLYYQTEQFDAAIRFMQDYVREFPQDAEASDYFIIAGAYAQKDDYRGALAPAERALQLDQAAGNRTENYYGLLNLIYSELNMSTKRRGLLEQAVNFFPNTESYWSQLAFLYNEANRNADALAVLELAYKAGLITDGGKIRTLAQFYYDQNNPFRGAKLLSSEMQAGNVARNLSNLELLAQLWAAAREQEEAIAILAEAAPKRSDGSLYYQLGQSYLADERYQLAIRNLREAIRRGGLTEREIGNAYVLIGTALFQEDSDSAESRAAARREFVRAGRYPGQATTSRSWVTYIDTIERTLEQQREVELRQAIERKDREITRCESILDVIELGGRTEVPEEQIASCRDLVAVIEGGETAESLVRAELGLDEEEEADAEAPAEEG